MSVIPSHSLAPWLGLIRVSGIGAKSARLLVDHFKSPDAVFSASAASLQKLGVSSKVVSALHQFDWRVIEPDLQWLEQDGHHVITFHDECFPDLLKEIPDFPVLLYVQGDSSLLSSPQLGMVGSRNPSSSGRASAFQFAQFLAQSGFTITSGLAHGVDGASHEGALKATGKTVAVLGTSLDYIYPKAHKKLAETILVQGVLVSEFPMGTPPLPKHFPRRNRIISGLSVGVLVVEAAVKSGSLITARLAMEYAREVFAIPSSIHNPMAKGCHALIKQGAKLVENGQDIVDELSSILGFMEASVDSSSSSGVSELVAGLSDLQKHVLGHIGFEPTSVDEIAGSVECSLVELTQQLLHLELAGVVSSQVGGYVRCG